jgi:hypothetical protein
MRTLQQLEEEYRKSKKQTAEVDVPTVDELEQTYQSSKKGIPTVDELEQVYQRPRAETAAPEPLSLRNVAATLGKSGLQVLGAPVRAAADVSKLIPMVGLGAGKLVGSKKLTKASQKSLAELERLKKNFQFVDEGYTDTAMSMLLGGVSGAGTRALIEAAKPAAQLARTAGITEPLLVTGAKAGLVSAIGDKLVVDPALQVISKKIDESQLDPATKDLLRATAPLAIGFVSGATIEAKMDRLLKNPLAVNMLNEMAESGTSAEVAVEKLKNVPGVTGRSSETSQALSSIRKEITSKKAVPGKTPPEEAPGGARAPKETPETPKLKDLEAKYQLAKSSGIHPSLLTSPLGGVAAGVDWEEFREDGTIKFNPKRALMGTFVGAAGGAGVRPARRLANDITSSWDTFSKQRIIDPIKDVVNGLIVNEDVRFALGLDRSKQFQDIMRDYHRSADTIISKSLELGKRIQEIAPTKAEQKRFLQIVRGGITSNEKMAANAAEIHDMFKDLRKQLKEHHLLQYSRFDELTRKERAQLRNIINHPERFDATPEQVETARQRLHDHYHFGSASEYAPLYYAKYEGLTPKQKQIIRDEITELKKKSRRGNPEGSQELEAQIAELTKFLKENSKKTKLDKKELDKGYSHRRLSMPIDIQRMLGRIDEAPYPVAKGVATQTLDIRKARLFKDIAEHPNWVMEGPGGVPANFVRVQDERFGALNGKWVRKDIWDDLKEVEEWRNAFTKAWDKYQGMWKYGKVVLNPATHARNFMSNMILAYFGDVKPTDIKTYTRAVQALKRGEIDPYYKEAKDWGLFRSSFADTEIMKLRDNLETLRGNQVQNWTRKAVSLPAETYQANEHLFKMAVFIKARSQGLGVDEAAQKAEHYIFNYSDIPPWVKHTKRWVSPFMTFAYKAIPLAAEMAIRKPWKIGTIAAGMYGLEEYSKRKLGMTEEEAETERALLPPWQQRRIPPGIGPYTHILIPFQDKWGNNLYWDLSYILPYGTMGEEWGQTLIPFADIMPSSPLFQTVAAIMTNRDPFTGRDIYNPVLDSTAEIAKKYLDYVWKEAAPSLAPGGYSANKLLTGFKNTFLGKDVRDWADRPIEFQTALLSTMLGIKLSPANTKKLLEFERTERKRIDKEVGIELKRLERELQRNKITRDEYEREAKELFKIKKQLLQERPTIRK